MSDTGVHRYFSPPGELHGDRKSYVPPSVQDEYSVSLRPAQIPSPPMSETSNPPLTEQQTGLSPEVIAHLTERIKKEVVEHLKQSGNIDTVAELSRAETLQSSELNADQSKSEPMAPAASNDKSRSTPSPPMSAQRVHTPPSPNSGARRATISSNSPLSSPLRSPPDSPTIEKPGVRFMNSRGPVDKDGGRNGRPAAYRSSSSYAELSTIDLKWGRLFDNNLNSTPRLGQFLKGLANHIIEEFHPKRSIVVTPDKMAAFYANHSVEDEVYPLTSIFGSQSHENLSLLYQELDCQHHLVQEESFKEPIIPGLTPEGFAHWITTWILAYPDQEAKRLEKVVLSTPIDADGETVDGKPERLPKQISRHLLPNKDDAEAKKALGEAISHFLDDLGKSKTRKPSIASPPRPRRISSSMQSKSRPIDIPQINASSKGVERDQMPYSKSPSDVGISREAGNIERIRQPYTAKPGNGKVYTESLAVPHTARPGRAYSASRAARDHEPEPEYRARHNRTQSNASNNPFIVASRPGGARRAQSPPIKKFSSSNPSNLDTGGDYLPEQFGPPPKQSQSFSPTSYTTSKYIPNQSEMRERDRDRDKYGDPRRSERRNTNDEPRPRRNTQNDPFRLRPEITTPRDAARWDQIYENRDKSRDRDRKYEPKSAGPILHQEFRPDVRISPSELPDEEYYLRAPTAPRGGEYEPGQGGKYYPRK